MRRTCERCGGQLDLLRPGRVPRFCSPRCRVAAHRAPVPTELRERDRWVRWTPSKRPIRVDGSPASATDPSTWASYAQVRAHRRKGFVLGDGIGCVDVDHVIVDGVLTDAARAFVDSLPATYTEISPSGDGLHLWFWMPEGPGSRRVVGGVSVETYSVSRYITVTGRVFRGSVSRLAVWPES
ncbi:bifunctional DNA primase/polymerase [Rhodococcus jostii]|uniref:bifunctional DNA primase/polymerase n=1 Tax=Rhodococcus jostii TaxID=132919 RepID=UPI00363E67FA